MMPKPVDERGIPTVVNENGSGSEYCPDKPCDLCTGHSACLRPGMDHTNLRELLEARDEKAKDHYLTSWELCQDMNTCTATVDWEKVYGR